MKVLIMSVTAGQGHNSTAKAMSAYLTDNGCDVRILDTLRYINTFLGLTVDKGYLFLSSKAKLAYKSAYRLAEKRKKSELEISPSALTVRMAALKIKKYVDNYNPDVIICTHVFAGVFIDILKHDYDLKAKSIGILTDFAFHPYWEDGVELDFVVVPDKILMYQALQKGFEENQVLPFGIPINPRFENKISKQEARRKLALDENKTTILVMGGSMGYGNIGKTLESIDKIDADFQVINVCGNNKRTKEKIDKMEFSKTVLNLGFTDNIDELMDAADLIVSKPGGLTTSEALAKGLPMVIVNPIPGQEERNTEFLLNNGCAMQVTNTLGIEEIIYIMLNNKGKLELMKNNALAIAHKDSTKKICNFALDLCSGK